MRSMTCKEIDGVRIGYTRIEVGDGQRTTRRQRERAAVEVLLREMLGYDAVLEHDEHGAPHIEGWKVSITHSARLAAAALSTDKTIGIDAEEWRDTLVRVRHKYLTESEIGTIDNEGLLRAWTVKEAVYKAAGIPALPFTDIEADGDTATVGDVRFALHTLQIDNTLLTLAIKI